MAEIKLNSKEIERILKSSGARSELTRRMERVKAQAGEGYEIEQVTHDRAVTRVAGKSVKHQADTGELVRALRAAGGD